MMMATYEVGNVEIVIKNRFIRNTIIYILDSDQIKLPKPLVQAQHKLGS